MRAPAIPSTLIHKICGVTDPFCTHAVGAKTPDGSAARTLAYPFHSSFTMGTDGVGNAAAMFVPSYNYALQVLPSAIAGDQIAWGNPLVGGAPLPAVSGYRIVSFGVKISGIAAPLSASGTVSIRGFGQRAGGSMSYTSAQSYTCDWYGDSPLRTADEICIIGRKLDDTANFFHSPLETTPTDLLTDWIAPGWGAFQVSVIGGPPSVGVLRVQVFVNMELAFTDNEPLALLATPSPKFTPEFNAISKEVSSTAKNVFLKGAEQVARWTVQAAGRAAMNALSKRFPIVKAGQLAIEVD